MIVATRTLAIVTDGFAVAVDVRVFVPQAEDGAWICRYDIAWPEGQRASSAGGIDAVQALHLALQKIGVDLYMSEHHAAGRLMWLEPDQGYGFPVPKNGRDFLIGQDKVFEG